MDICGPFISFFCFYFNCFYWVWFENPFFLLLSGFWERERERVVSERERGWRKKKKKKINKKEKIKKNQKKREKEKTLRRDCCFNFKRKVRSGNVTSGPRIFFWSNFKSKSPFFPIFFCLLFFYSCFFFFSILFLVSYFLLILIYFWLF